MKLELYVEGNVLLKMNNVFNAKMIVVLLALPPTNKPAVPIANLLVWINKLTNETNPPKDCQ